MRPTNGGTVSFEEEPFREALSQPKWEWRERKGMGVFGNDFALFAMRSALRREFRH